MLYEEIKILYIILLLYVDNMVLVGYDMQETNKLKKQMSSEFEMKDLGATKRILGKSIAIDRFTGTLILSQVKYIKKVLENFNTENVKVRSTPLGSQLRLTKKQSPKTEDDIEYMAKVFYASAVGSLMYVMVCTRLDIAHAVGVMIIFMSNLGKRD